jgi:hypothetical protein
MLLMLLRNLELSGSGSWVGKSLPQTSVHVADNGPLGGGVLPCLLLGTFFPVHSHIPHPGPSVIAWELGTSGSHLSSQYTGGWDQEDRVLRLGKKFARPHLKK